MAHNIDITEDVIPVGLQHIPALVEFVRTCPEELIFRACYAAGEVASTGLHGANRLPSNSFLESVVYGARAGRSMRVEMRTITRRFCAPTGGPLQ